MIISASTLAFLVALAPAALAQEPAGDAEAFPPSTALAEGVSPEALANLSQLVQSLVDDEEVVGAELLVIKDGKSILHEAYGWSDLEAKVPMETGSVFCVRSMTKPVIGAAISMLIEDGKLELDDPVAKYLPSFDAGGAEGSVGTRGITVGHLLTHTGGLPMSLIMGKDLRDLGSIRAVADLGGGVELEFEPGSAFNYSDQGTDTLTALIEVASGMTAEEFVSTRVLEPLGMQDSACVLREDSPLRARAIPNYAGTRGQWTRFWSPDEPPLFPFFLGSQGLYSTLEDYARFTEFWLRKGRSRSGRLLKSRYVRRVLDPGPYPLGGSTGFSGLRADYGSLMTLWTGPGAVRKDGREREREVVVFGHAGSDGTHAWVFPEQKAMVLYFTQSRQNMTGLRVEEALGTLLLGAPFDSNAVAPPFEEYLGYYWEGEGDVYRAIVRDGDDLALEILGKAVVPLTYVGEDRWKMRPNPSVVLAFDRSPDDEGGAVTGYHIGDHQEFRFEPSPELPSADELADRVMATHRLDLLESLGPVRMNGKLSIGAFNLTGELSILLDWPDRFLIQSSAKDQVERVAYDGTQVRYAAPNKPVVIMEGARAETTRLENALARLGDWRRWYPSLEVIQYIQDGEYGVYLVRGGDTSAPAPTLFVLADTGQVVHEESMTFIETVGRIGQELDFRDFRDVSGMLLPHRIELEIANPMIGKIVMTIDEVELGVELPEGTFELRE